MNKKLKLNLKRAFWIECMFFVFSLMMGLAFFIDGDGFLIPFFQIHFALFAVFAVFVFFYFCCDKLADLLD